MDTEVTEGRDRSCGGLQWWIWLSVWASMLALVPSVGRWAHGAEVQGSACGELLSELCVRVLDLA